MALRAAVAALLFAAMTVAMLVAVPQSAHAARSTLTASRTAPIQYEKFTFTYRMKTSIPRKVWLQRKQGSKWVTLSKKKSSARGKGTFGFATVAGKRSFRAYAPAVKYKKKKYRATATSSTVVGAVAQTSRIVIAPSRSGVGKVTLTVLNKPARVNRVVQLQQLSATRAWVTLKSGKQSSTGTTTFEQFTTAAAADTKEYRAVTLSRNGAKALASPRMIFNAPSRLPTIHVTTDAKAEIKNKTEYVNGSIAVNARGSDLPSFAGRTRIRLRGNSSVWPQKRSYKVKLDSRATVLGMPASKDWVLLANFYDRSMLRNAAALEVSRRLSVPWTPRMQFAEVWLNGEYRGLYQWGEGIELAKDRVDITELKDDAADITGGYLLEADSWDDTDPFFTTSRGLRTNIKEPEDLPVEQRAYITDYVQQFEDALYGDNFDDPDNGYASFIDVDSFVNWYIVNELMKSVDSSLRNSCWMVKDAGEKLAMGPVWDFDMSAGNRTTWNIDDPTGWLIRRNWETAPDDSGRSPSQIRVAQGHWFNRLFEDPAFAAKVQSRWNAVESQLRTIPSYVDESADLINKAAETNFTIWPLGMTLLENETHLFQGSWAGEAAYLSTWLRDRVAWMSSADIK